MPQLASQLRWLIGIRLVVITSVVLPYFLVLLSNRAEYESWEQRRVAEFLGPPELLYLLAGFTYVASLLYIVLLALLRRRLTIQAYIQFVGDLLLVTGLIWYFGGVSSPFSILYLIVISVASTLLRRRVGVTVATIAWVLYGGTVLGLHLGWLPPLSPVGEEGASTWRIAYGLAMHLFGFYAVAFLTSQLAQTVTRTERELEEKSEDLADLRVAHRDVIDSIPSGLITTDLKGTITSVNPAGREILGLPEADLVGRRIYEFGFPPEERWLSFVNHRETNSHREEIHWKREDRGLWIGFSVTTLTNAEGSPTGYILIFQDLTEWRKLQDEVQLKDRMAAVGTLAAGIAHEIGNPLAAISGSVQLLSDSRHADSPQQKLLDIILKESQRLDRTIKGFLKFARPKERTSVRFDVAQLLAENLELLRNSPEVSDRHRLDIDLNPPSVNLIGDPDQISQIFWNLSRNALRAMPEGGRLRVLGRLIDRGYRIQFVDTGRGMSTEERANIFHPFQSFFDKGTGIGMAIVYRIVQEHGGRLAVDSQRGDGTTITIELPTPAAAPSVRQPAGV